MKNNISDFKIIFNFIESKYERMTVEIIPMIKLIFKVEKINPMTMGIRIIIAKVFQKIFNVILFAITSETTKPIIDPIVNAKAAPVIPNIGTNVKYRIVRGIFMARFIVIACL